MKEYASIKIYTARIPKYMYVFHFISDFYCYFFPLINYVCVMSINRNLYPQVLDSYLYKLSFLLGVIIVSAIFGLVRIKWIMHVVYFVQCLSYINA